MTKQIEKGQRFALHRLLKELGADNQKMRMFIISELIGRTVTTTYILTRRDWQNIRNAAYEHWYEDDWTICDEFRRHVGGLIRIYRTKIMGQLELF